MDTKEIQLKLNEYDQGGLFLEENGKTLAELRFVVADKVLIAYHTRVSDEMEGHGIGTKLFNMMVDYARAQRMKVVALCPFVNAQFKKQPEAYHDICQNNILVTL